MWLIVGVSGATCSGKSSLAHCLKNTLPGSKLVCQDDFFLPEDSELHTWIPALKHNNWEIMSSLDMDKMHEAVKDILSSESKSNTVFLHTLETIADVTSKSNESQKTLKSSGDSDSVLENLKINGDSCTPCGQQDLGSSKLPYGINILIIEGFLIFNDKKLADLCHMKYFLTLNRDECWARRRIRTYNPPDVPGYFDVCVWPEYVKHRDQAFKEVSDINVIDGTLDKTSILNQVLVDIVNRARDMLSKEG